MFIDPATLLECDTAALFKLKDEELPLYALAATSCIIDPLLPAQQRFKLRERRKTAEEIILTRSKKKPTP